MCYYFNNHGQHTRCGFVATLFTLVIIVMFSASVVHAMPTLSLGDGVKSSTTITFPLTLSGSQSKSIASLIIDLKFDTDMLSLIMNAGKSVSASAGTDLPAGKQLDQSATADGVLRIVIAGQGGTTINDGIIANISFNSFAGRDPSWASFSLVSEGADVQSAKVDFAPRLPGDILGRGQVIQLRDSLLVLYFIVGAYNLTLDQREFVDMNGDNKVDVGDAIMVLSKVVGL